MCMYWYVLDVITVMNVKNMNVHLDLWVIIIQYDTVFYKTKQRTFHFDYIETVLFIVVVFDCYTINGSRKKRTVESITSLSLS